MRKRGTDGILSGSNGDKYQFLYFEITGKVLVSDNPNNKPDHIREGNI